MSEIDSIEIEKKEQESKIAEGKKNKFEFLFLKFEF